MSALKSKKMIGVLVVGLAFFSSPAAFPAETVKIGAMFISSGKIEDYFGSNGRHRILKDKIRL